MNLSTVAANEPFDQHPSEVAYTCSLPEIDAVESAEGLHITVDMTRAVTIALGALPKVLALRAEIEAAFRAMQAPLEATLRFTGHLAAERHWHRHCMLSMLLGWGRWTHRYEFCSATRATSVSDPHGAIRSWLRRFARSIEPKPL